VLQASDVNEMRDATHHDRIALLGDIALTCIVRQEEPVIMLAYQREYFRVGSSRSEILLKALDPIPCVFEGIGYGLPEITVGKEGVPMLRIRRRVLPLARRVPSRSPQ
jgi:hypothetical protein